MKDKPVYYINIHSDFHAHFIVKNSQPVVESICLKMKQHYSDVLWWAVNKPATIPKRYLILSLFIFPITTTY